MRSARNGPDYNKRAMDTAWLLVKCLPFFAAVAYGVYAVLEVFFPALRDENFNRWEINDDSGSSIEIMGWRKVLRPPRVLAQGYLSERTACAIALTTGTVLVVVGFFGIHRIAGIP